MTGSGSSLGPLKALREHWPEYLIEAWALGMFMVSAGAFSTLLAYPQSPAIRLLPNEDLRRALIGVAMGVTAVLLIYSPWGKRSGAHMNPAVTLTFLRLRKIAFWDAVFYIAAQFIGGWFGVLLTAAALGDAFTSPPVLYIVTEPGSAGPVAAFVAEVFISALMIGVILYVSNTPPIARFTGLCAGVLVALFITFEAPLSGMSMNPARSFASAAPGGFWSGLWIYFLAPVLGMQLAATVHVLRSEARRAACAKLQHPPNQRCIHCSHEPDRVHNDASIAT